MDLVASPPQPMVNMPVRWSVWQPHVHMMQMSTKPVDRLNERSACSQHAPSVTTKSSTWIGWSPFWITWNMISPNPQTHQTLRCSSPPKHHQNMWSLSQGTELGSAGLSPGLIISTLMYWTHPILKAQWMMIFSEGISSKKLYIVYWLLRLIGHPQSIRI